MQRMYDYLNEQYERVYGMSVADVARQFGYGNSAVALVDKNRTVPYSKQYPKEYANLASCKHQRDSRTEDEYGMDIVATWTVENFIVLRLEEAGCKVTLSGADRRREILPSGKVEGTADMTVSYGKYGPRKVELVCDGTEFWARTGKMHLRDEKFSHLVKENAILLGIDMMNRKFYMLDASALSGSDAVKKLKRHPVWKKPAVEIDLKTATAALITGRDTGENMRNAFCCLCDEQITQNSEKSVDKCIKERYNDNSWNGYYPIFIPAAFFPKTTNNNVNTMN